MISRKVRRPTQSVENVKQFSLNNSGGVNCVSPHNAQKTLYGSKNLTVNFDGSVSVRLPIVLNNRFTSDVVRVIPLPYDSYIAICKSGFTILNSSLMPVVFRISWRDMYDTERVKEVSAGTIVPKTTLNIDSCAVAETSTGVVLSKCKLCRTATDFPGTAKDSLGTYRPIFDSKLYDSATASDFSTRLVNVVYSTALQMWCVHINTPYPNEYFVENGTLKVSYNMAHDNLFATRDTYDVAAPSVKTIRAYAYTARQPEGIVLADSLKDTLATDTRTDLSWDYDSTSRLYAENEVSGTTHREFEFKIKKTQPIVKFENVEICLELSMSGTYHLSQTISATSTPSVVTSLLSQNLDSTSCTLIARKVSEGTDVTQLPNFKIVIPKTTWDMRADHTFFSLQGAGDFVTLGTLIASNSTSGHTITKDSFVQDVVRLETFALDHVSNKLFSKTPSMTTLNFLWMSERSELGIHIVPSSSFAVTMSYTYSTPTVSTDIRVADLTESVKNTRFRAATTIDFNAPNMIVLKAFLNFPTAQFDKLYCSWRYTLDGVNWTDALSSVSGSVSVEEDSQDPIEDVAAPVTSSSAKAKYTYAPLLSGTSVTYSFENNITSRGDCFILKKRSDVEDDAWSAVAFKFKLVSLNADGKTVKANYGESLFYKAVGAVSEFEDSDFGNVADGNVFYNNSRIYCYGALSLKNAIFFSYPNELEFPVTNAIELSAGLDREVTAVIRWRNYIISATSYAIYVSEQQGDAFYTKAANVAIGIPKNDSGCCVPVLNGIIFKSGSKVYQMYPNLYSDDSTVLNVSDISQGVAHYLEACDDAQNSFAFSTDSEYILMLPATTHTRCLRYNYTTKVWTYCEYPIQAKLVKVNALDDICLLGTLSESGTVCDVLFDTKLEDVSLPTHVSAHVSELPYGDVVTRNRIQTNGAYGTDIGATVSDLEAYLQGVGSSCVTPIQFELDTGQKTDTVLTTKQFVESKLVFATEHGDDAFPMQLTVHVDGDPHIVTKDISTDASFWKDDGVSGVLNTTFNGLSSTSDSFNTLRQLVVRYSGKGKSIRHILTGESLCNFKLYETYIRYKLLNVKQ